jgi:FAD/FMN-containing dehydrogenase
MTPHRDDAALSGTASDLKVPVLASKRSSKGDPMMLPPGCTSEHFHTFITKASEICGKENVTIISVDHELIDGDYMHQCKGHDMHAVVDREYFVASAIVAPREVPEVQATMRLCNEFDIPVWPFSIGRNTGYGGAAPRVPGSVCLELGRHMNKILEVNTEGAYALVEPGVTYFDLHEYLEKHNLREKVWLDVSLRSQLPR